MSDAKLTLMVVHAHPDDEVLSTGGVLHRYSQQGIETVLVTCTGGELGDAPGGIKPGQAGHDEAAVRELRKRELEESCRLLGVSHLERLGYLDSGMEGWEQNGRPGSLSGSPLEEEAELVAALIRQYQPQVLVTYDENGGYGHPDHVRTHQLAVAAFRQTQIPSKLYYAVIPKSAVASAGRKLVEMGIDPATLTQEGLDPENPPFGVDDSVVTTVVDVEDDSEAKLAALRAHGSQSDNAFFLRFPEAAVRAFLAREHFALASPHPAAPVHEEDLFAGLR